MPLQTWGGLYVAPTPLRLKLGKGPVFVQALQGGN